MMNRGTTILRETSTYIIELDDGKIFTGKPDQFDGKNPWVSGVDFPFNQSNEYTFFSVAVSSNAPIISAVAVQRSRTIEQRVWR